MNQVECIFSINTGRCGSDYLKTIFDHVERCEAFHEPKPIGNGRAMRLFSRGHVEPMRRLARKKAVIIATVTQDDRLYVETNHCFIKGFGWFLPQHIRQDRIGVIVLRRNPDKVAKSLLRIGCSPLTDFGRRWITVPEKKNPLVPAPKLFISARLSYLFCCSSLRLYRQLNSFRWPRSKTPLKVPKWLSAYEFDCTIWYIHEIVALGEAFKKQYPGIRYYETAIDDLNDIVKVERMLNYFGLRPRPSLTTVVGTPTNVKRSKSPMFVISE